MTIDATTDRTGAIETVIEVKPLVRDTPSDVISDTVSDTTMHDLMSLLTRDVQIGHFTYETTSTPLPTRKDDVSSNGPLVKFDFPKAIFDNSPVIRTKLQHFQIFKADVILTLRVNSNPFQSGGLIPVYTPYVDGIADERDEGSRFLASMTSNVSDVFSLEEGNTFELRVPYANAMDYFNLRDATHQFGSIQVWPACPLRSLEPTDTVSVTAFARFDNPTALVPTDSNNLTALSRKMLIDSLTQEEIQYRIAQPQGAEGDCSGPVSAVANAVGSVASSLSGIPGVSKIAAPVSWAARAVSGVASVFGFSKDTNNGTVTYVNPAFARFAENTDGQDNSRMLAMTADNRIDSSKLVVDDQDEMCFNKIKRRKAYVQQWQSKSVDLTAGSLIGSMEVTPLWPNLTKPTANYGFFFSAFQYVTSNFRFWNGSLEYVLTIFKTQLCSGRLVLVYFPNGTPPATLGDILNTNHHKFIDLNPKDGSRVIHVGFSIPYVREKPWLRSDPLVASKDENNNGTGGDFNGKVALYVLNTVIFPPTIDDGLDFLLAISGGEDFSVAVPEFNYLPSYRKATAQVLEASSPEIVPLFQHSKSIGMQEKYTMGEVFVSLRALIKRFNPVWQSSSTNLLTYAPTKFYLDQGLHEYREVRSYHLNPDDANDTFYYVKLYPSWLWLSSFIYRFWAGSTRIKLYGGDGDRVYYSLAHVVEGEDCEQEKTEMHQGLASNYTHLDPQGFHHFTTNPVLELSLPFSSDRSGRIVAAKRNGIHSTTTGVNFAFQKGSANWIMSEAGGDDFSFWFLTGPPRCVRYTDIYGNTPQFLTAYEVNPKPVVIYNPEGNPVEAKGELLARYDGVHYPIGPQFQSIIAARPKNFYTTTANGDSVKISIPVRIVSLETEREDSIFLLHYQTAADVTTAPKDAPFEAFAYTMISGTNPEDLPLLEQYDIYSMVNSPPTVDPTAPVVYISEADYLLAPSSETLIGPH